MKKPAENSALIEEYSSKLPIYEALASKLEMLLKDIISRKGITILSITSRCKGSNSLAGKLEKKATHYKLLTDITDLVGLRVITYFSDDVDKIAQIIQQEFELDEINSVDKRNNLEADRFGYLSLHHIASLNEQRTNLIEYSSFKGLKFEVQIRSTLQHAWAEIEHDLGYKTAVEIPQHIRRRFARVAGLLELADQEFEGIKNELATYREKVSAEIKESPATVLLDKDSLLTFIENDATVNRIDKSIVEMVNGEIYYLGGYSPAEVSMLEMFDISTIADVAKLLADNEGLIRNFAKNWLVNDKYDQLPAGICLFYLWYIMLGKTGDLELVKKLVDDSPVSPFAGLETFAQRILDTYQKAIA